MSEIKPALTAEEWADKHHRERFDWWISADEQCTGGCTEEENLHQIAAHCLHDQPFGFTRFDARHLRRLADVWRVDGEPHAFFSSLADRIEALLPPETP